VILMSLPGAAAAEVSLPPGFTAKVYVTGEGFDESRRAIGIPSTSALVFGADGTLYASRSGRRYVGGEIEDVWPIYRFPPGGARLTKETEGRAFYGPPLPNPQVAGVRGGEVLVTTYDRDRVVGVLYRLVDGRAEMLAGGSPPSRLTPPMLKQPEGVGFDPEGNLLIADRQHNAVMKLDAAGKMLDPRWLLFTRPRLLVVRGDRLWVAADGDAEAPWARGKGEVFFREVAMKAVRYSKSAKFVADEFQELETKLHDKYICNFSVFQSVPDHWALDQLFPIIPVHRLNEPPTRKATLADITCDSDGEVEKFVDLKDIKDALEVHELKEGEAYYLAFALVGAYQDTMGDMHNLFGRVNEAEVILGPKGTPVVTDVRRGEPACETLASFGYDRSDLTEAVKAQLRERTNRGEISAEDAAAFLENYSARLSQYTYLD